MYESEQLTKFHSERKKKPGDLQSLWRRECLCISNGSMEEITQTGTF
jgi:hypothetical protein